MLIYELPVKLQICTSAPKSFTHNRLPRFQIEKQHKKKLGTSEVKSCLENKSSSKMGVPRRKKAFKHC